jgi:hypothetical protein
MISVASTYLETLPGEEFLTKHLQNPIKFILGQKVIKQGKLILFKRTHYYIQITVQNTKSFKESFEIPIPFKTEEYISENLIYFDYRLSSLVGYNNVLIDKVQKIKFKHINPSQYYNKILEIQAERV